MKNKNNKNKTLAYILGQAFGVTLMVCVIALTAGVTVKILSWLF